LPKQKIMARIFITGSSDGLGNIAARLLIAEGHQVIVHGRNQRRAEEAMNALPGAENAVYGDLSFIQETREVAEQVNKLGAMDAIIHNAGIGYGDDKPVFTRDSLPPVFAVNSVAPYILTCLIHKPKRLVYISSGLHRSGDATLADLTWKDRTWDSFRAYSDSKLHNVLLSFAVAERWTDVLSNAIEPGWVATKMGGPGAPDDLVEGAKTQAWLAVSNDREALVTGRFFFHKKLQKFHPMATNKAVQNKLITEYERITGISFPH
jgi:NAD(P)-dependent dehydrogenase (short-subunit alcohol dehydrogenase family)